MRTGRARNDCRDCRQTSAETDASDDRERRTLPAGRRFGRHSQADSRSEGALAMIGGDSLLLYRRMHPTPTTWLRCCATTARRCLPILELYAKKPMTDRAMNDALLKQSVAE